MGSINSESALRAIIGRAPEALKIKKIDLLERHSQRYLEKSTLIAIACASLPHRIQLMATRHSSLEVIGRNHIRLEVKHVPDDLCEISAADCGLYVLIAGFQESLRINGKLTIRLTADTCLADIEIRELYFHCAKSIMRSDFWTAKAFEPDHRQGLSSEAFGSGEVRRFIEQSPFLLLASQNEQGDTDLSPRGDPPGFVRIVDNDSILIPERPGNRIADSLTNILSNPAIAVMLFIPGIDQTLTLIGRGTLTSSPAALSSSAINDRAPRLGIELRIESCFYGINPALTDMDLWNPEKRIDRSAFPSLGKILAEQLQATNRVPGNHSAMGRILGKAAGTIADVAIQNDYKKNLY